MQRTLSLFAVSLTLFGTIFLSSAWSAELPDIVVYLADDLSADDLSTYGGRGIETASAEKLARAGMTFDRAFVASPSCAPSRAALLTGLMPARNGAEENHTYPHKELLKLPRLLNRMGYQTAAFGKVAHNKSAKDYGFEVINLQKDFPDLQTNVADFLTTRKDSRPLALFVGTSNPHVPWPADGTIPPSEIDLPPKLLDTPQTRVQRSRYMHEVRELDLYLGKLRDLASKTLGSEHVFIFSSDHGAQFPFGKWTLYDEGIRVPLIIDWPGRTLPGTRTDAMVSWIDLLPTIIDAAGGALPEGIDGRSFAAVLDNSAESHREAIYTTHSGDRKMNVYPSRSVRTQRYKFIHNLHPEFAFTTHIDLLVRTTSGDYFLEWQELAKTDAVAARTLAAYHGRHEFELYDLATDREERINLAGSPEHADVMAALKEKLHDWMKQQGDAGTVFHPPLLLDAPETWRARK